MAINSSVPSFKEQIVFGNSSRINSSLKKIDYSSSKNYEAKKYMYGNGSSTGTKTEYLNLSGELPNIRPTPYEPKRKRLEDYSWYVADDGEEEDVSYLECLKESIVDFGATAYTGAVSVVEGAGKLGECIVDTCAVVGAAEDTFVLKTWDKITGDDHSADIKSIQEGVKEFVSNDYVGDFFDTYYDETDIGKWAKEHSYAHETVRSVGSGVGYAAGIIGLSVLTGGTATPALMATWAATAGVGKGAETAWKDGATFNQGLVTGVATAGWEGLQFYLGGTINGLSPFNKTLSNIALRVGLDTLDGGAEGFVQPLIESIYKNVYYSEDTNGIRSYASKGKDDNDNDIYTIKKVDKDGNNIGLEFVSRGKDNEGNDVINIQRYDANGKFIVSDIAIKDKESGFYFKYSIDENGNRVDSSSMESININDFENLFKENYENLVGYKELSGIDKYKYIFDSDGGWSQVGVQAAVGFITSTASEGFEYSVRKGQLGSSLSSIEKKIAKNPNATLSKNELVNLEIARKQLGLSDTATSKEITDEIGKIYKNLDYDRVNIKDADFGVLKKLSDSVDGLDPRVQKDILSGMTGVKSFNEVKNVGQLDMAMEKFISNFDFNNIKNLDPRTTNTLRKYMSDKVKFDTGVDISEFNIEDILANYKKINEFKHTNDYFDITMDLDGRRLIKGYNAILVDYYLDVTQPIPAIFEPVSSTTLKPSKNVQYLESLETLSEEEMSKYKSQLKLYSNRYDISADELQEILDDKMKSLMNESSFGCRKSIYSLSKSLDEGSFKTIFETNGESSGLSGDVGLRRRQELETTLFHRPAYIDPKDTPLSGTLLPNTEQGIDAYMKRGPGSWYGGNKDLPTWERTTEAMVLFNKQKVMNDTTFTIGDSLDCRNRLMPSLVTQPEFRGAFEGFFNDLNTLDDIRNAPVEKLFDSRRVGNQGAYLELQLHGSAAKSVDAIEAVVFAKEPPQELKSKLINLNIQYRVIGEKNWRNCS